MATKRNFEIKMLSYNDSTESNNPTERLFDNTVSLTDDLGDEVQSQIESIAALATDVAVNLGAAAVRVLFLENLSTTLALTFKINAGTAMTLGPGGVMYFESANAADAAQITALTVSNASASTAVRLKIFCATSDV